ncbi:fatty acid desaturase family protein [Xenorhabdus sp. BG5]|uniref:fatty acid desaturase family protein n=1 Tax=Xenorhabdus sp. BG5 TaxID=2782014 RepID=UPI00188308B4|nr:fatty acid desaturase family protein [Xenorhabdus sp. BG5]MBE8598130.1 fatty acid desaturase family protein [Xenorhabdus sp. BG5]
MRPKFHKPILNNEQIKRLKLLYRKNNYRGLISITEDIIWIIFAIFMSVYVHYGFYIISIIIIGARQRALASLFHEAAHGNLFRSKWMNNYLARILCGWSILQSLNSYKKSHVHDHHLQIGNHEKDPDYKYMLEAGVYDEQPRSLFIKKFILAPLLGSITPKYILFLLKHRLLNGIQKRDEYTEVISIITIHLILIAAGYYFQFIFLLLLFWWIPLLVIHPIIGWYSELAEHYPLMSNSQNFYSRNRYAGKIERLFIGMHSDYLHLTHHLLPGVPFWNLPAATQILREDEEFCQWDNMWGGIFSSENKKKISLIKYIIDNHLFISHNLIINKSSNMEHTCNE